MSYKVKIDVFEGPIPLLLHLIQQEEVEIYDISIAQITAQYLEYISAMQDLNLEIASEFLIMAARLIQIKSKMLLPQDNSSVDEEDEIDPRQELINRLLEYKKYKELAQCLQSYEQSEQKHYTRDLHSILKEIDLKEPEQNPLEDISLESFVELFEEVIKSGAEETRAEQKEKAQREQKLRRLRRKEISIQEKMEALEKRLATQGKIGFKELFVGVSDRLEIVVSFMALLELMRLKKVVVKQSQAFQEIQIYNEGVRDDAE